MVYGGGGVMPDVFVPLDTAQITKFHVALRRNNLITETTLRYIDNHRKELRQQYKTFAVFERDFVVPQSLIDEILAAAKAKKITPKDDKELANTIEDLRFSLSLCLSTDCMNRATSIILSINETTLSKKHSTN